VSAPARTALVGEIDRLGGEPVLVVASARDPQLIGELVAPLGVRVAGSFTEVREHVPVATADVLVAIGDGAAKASH
jgi:maleylacetate reductase